jgi:hypothetical protein
MESGKVYSKFAIVGVTPVIMEFRDTSGVLLPCTHVKVKLAQTAAGTDYVAITPSGIHEQYFDLSATTLTGSGVGGVVATANIVGEINVMPHQAFSSLRIKGNTASLRVIVTYGNLVPTSERSKKGLSQGS